MENHMGRNDNAMKRQPPSLNLLNSSDGVNSSSTTRMTNFPFQQSSIYHLLQTPPSPSPNTYKMPSINQRGFEPMCVSAGLPPTATPTSATDKCHNIRLGSRRSSVASTAMIQEVSLPQPFTNDTFSSNGQPTYPQCLPSPHRSLVASSSYSFHDCAQKAAVDNFYHRNPNEVTNKRFRPFVSTENQENIEQVTKFAKLENGGKGRRHQDHEQLSLQLPWTRQQQQHPQRPHLQRTSHSGSLMGKTISPTSYTTTNPDGPVLLHKFPTVGSSQFVAETNQSYIPNHTPNDLGVKFETNMDRSNSCDVASNSSTIRRNTQGAMAKTIAERHIDKPISEYAIIVRQAELAVLNMDSQTHSKTSVQIAEQNRERERQVYAFLWLMKNCVSQPDSYVPRGRIFAQYAASCAHNTLKPLSQASLGKLIRAVFPDLTTRRLGMRGQSRYHYCGLKLAPDDSLSKQATIPISDGVRAPPSATSIRKADSSPLPHSKHNSSLSSSSTTHVDNAIGYDSAGAGTADFLSGAATPAIAKLEPSPVSLEQFSNDYEMVFMEDLFEKVFANDVPIPSDYSLKFPPIPKENLPPGTDEDIVSALESLYHVHCSTIFEHIRFMKFDQLPHCLLLFGSGSISPQMYNLFMSPELYDWVFECDLITHVSLIKYLSRMVSDYENISSAVILKMDNFSKEYNELVSKAIIDLPVPMVTKKKEIAGNFSRLMRKLVKYLKFTKEISKILPNFKNMRQDWDSYVNLDDVLDFVNRDGYEKVIEIIKTFMTINVPAFLDELAAGHLRLDIYVKGYCELLSSVRDMPAYKIMDGIAMFSRAFMTDITLVLQQKGFPWYFLDMLSSLLVGYCFEINRFIC